MMIWKLMDVVVRINPSKTHLKSFLPFLVILVLLFNLKDETNIESTNDNLKLSLLEGIKNHTIENQIKVRSIKNSLLRLQQSASDTRQL